MRYLDVRGKNPREAHCQEGSLLHGKGLLVCPNPVPTNPA
jgi:hypothetical protein